MPGPRYYAWPIARARYYYSALQLVYNNVSELCLHPPALGKDFRVIISHDTKMHNYASGPPRGKTGLAYCKENYTPFPARAMFVLCSWRSLHLSKHQFQVGACVYAYARAGSVSKRYNYNNIFTGTNVL